MPREFTQHSWSPRIAEDLRRIVRLAVFEDLDRGQDWTTICLVPEEATASANIVARKPGVIAGVPAVPVILDEMEIEAQYHPLVQDGDAVTASSIVATLSGPARDLLTSERIILNILGRLSGVATLTRQYVEAIKGTNARLYDTRKTIPGWRRLDKYAVHYGGGHNHRTGLYDAILIKDNHLAYLGESAHNPSPSGRGWLPEGQPGEGLEISGAAASAPVCAFRLTRAFLAQQAAGELTPGSPDPSMLVEIEVDSLDQLREVLPESPDIVLLDNMTADQLRQAVQIRDAAAATRADGTRSVPTTELEASGGITLQNIRAIAESGIDRISIGALTHSASVLDLALDWK